MFKRNKLEDLVRGSLGLGEKSFFKKESWVKICQDAFGGHSKDREAGASGEGDPQTNAFASEGIKPWALKVRVGLNCATLLKIQQKHLFFPWMFQMPQIGPGVCCKKKKKIQSLFYWSCLRATFPASTEVQIFVSSINLENLPDRVAALYGRLQGFHWSHSGSRIALKVQYPITKP